MKPRRGNPKQSRKSRAVEGGSRARKGPGEPSQPSIDVYWDHPDPVPGILRHIGDARLRRKTEEMLREAPVYDLSEWCRTVPLPAAAVELMRPHLEGDDDAEYFGEVEVASFSDSYCPGMASGYNATLHARRWKGRLLFRCSGDPGATHLPPRSDVPDEDEILEMLGVDPYWDWSDAVEEAMRSTDTTLPEAEQRREARESLKDRIDYIEFTSRFYSLQRPYRRRALRIALGSLKDAWERNREDGGEAG